MLTTGHPPLTVARPHPLHKLLLVQEPPPLQLLLPFVLPNDSPSIFIHLSPECVFALGRMEEKLTWNYLKHPVFLHVCRQVACSHFVILDFD